MYSFRKNLTCLLTLVIILLFILTGFDVKFSSAIAQTGGQSCEDDDYQCFCKKGGTDAQIIKAIENQLKKCYPGVVKPTNVELPKPPISYERYNTAEHGSNCASTCCPGKLCIIPRWGSGIKILLCSPCSDDIGLIFSHEMGHWYDCYQPSVDKLSCQAILNHLELEYGVWGRCEDTYKKREGCFNIDCDIAKKRVVEYCKQLFDAHNDPAKNCPYTDTIADLCKKAGYNPSPPPPPTPTPTPTPPKPCSSNLGVDTYCKPDERCCLAMCVPNSRCCIDADCRDPRFPKCCSHSRCREASPSQCGF